MRSQEMRAHREDMQTRNQLLVMQMQQQAQQQQQLFTAFMQVAGGNVGAQPAAPFYAKSRYLWGSSATPNR